MQVGVQFRSQTSQTVITLPSPQLSTYLNRKCWLRPRLPSNCNPVTRLVINLPIRWKKLQEVLSNTPVSFYSFVRHFSTVEIGALNHHNSNVQGNILSRGRTGSQIVDVAFFKLFHRCPHCRWCESLWTRDFNHAYDRVYLPEIFLLRVLNIQWYNCFAPFSLNPDLVCIYSNLFILFSKSTSLWFR